MPPIRINNRDLLQYDASLRILICRDCQYAIQRSALESHLLRHKIYREDRKRILASCAQLDILEPDEIVPPSPASQPINGLPVLLGYCCTVDGCGNLCTSSKRMSMHQREKHHLQNNSELESCIRPAKLQTFFRGTKIRYFEVGSASSEQPDLLVLPTTSRTDATGSENRGSTEHGQGSPWAAQPVDPGESILDNRLSLPNGSTGFTNQSFNLDSLRYFHHFTTVTSLTLPIPDSCTDSTSYWQATILNIALRERWLMSGLLALSSSHLARQELDLSQQQAVLKPAAKLSHEFLASSTALLHRMPNEATGGVSEVDVVVANTTLRSIIHCLQYTVGGGVLGQQSFLEGTESPSFTSVLQTMKAFKNLNLKHGGLDGKLFTQLTNHLETQEATSVGTSLSSGMEPVEPLERLRDLPYRMAEVFGRPDNARGTLACISAIKALVECLEADTSPAKAWHRMVEWVCKVPDLFHDMLERKEAPALVVLAHWTAYLVRHAEQSGCWWLNGMETSLMQEIKGLLPAGIRSIDGLIAELNVED